MSSFLKTIPETTIQEIHKKKRRKIHTLFNYLIKYNNFLSDNRYFHFDSHLRKVDGIDNENSNEIINASSNLNN